MSADLEAGDRIKVAQLIKDEPCSDIDVLLGHTGIVLNPTVPDEDYDGNPEQLGAATAYTRVRVP